MAAQYADTHPSIVEGLVLWASYPGSANDLSDSDLRRYRLMAPSPSITRPSKAGNRCLPLMRYGWSSKVQITHSSAGMVYSPATGKRPPRVKINSARSLMPPSISSTGLMQNNKEEASFGLL